MHGVERIRWIRSLYDREELLDWEMVCCILTEVLNGDVLEFDEIRDLLSPDLGATMLRNIEAIEENDYRDRRAYVWRPLSEEEEEARAIRLKPTYQAIFAEIKAYFAALPENDPPNASEP